MGFIIFILILLFTIAIIYLLAANKSKNKKSTHHYGRNFYDDLDEDFYGEENINNLNNFSSPPEKDSSSFPYPDPYQMDPSESIYLNENGDINEDL